MSDEVKTTLEFDAAEGKHILRHTQDVSSFRYAN